MNLKETWNNSSTVLKVVIIAVVVLIVAALLIAVVSLSNRSEPPVPTPTPGGSGSGGGIIIVIPTPRPAQPTVQAITNVPMHTGPGYEYPLVGLLQANNTAEAVGINADGRWIAINVPNAFGEVAWVEAKLVQTSGTENLPVVVAPPAPTPTAAPPATFENWKGEYFANRNLEGTPALVQDDATINFDWGLGSPAPDIPPDNFSARWSVTHENVAAGTYRFSVWVDDGVRIWVDNVLIIDGWVEGSLRNYSADVNVTKGTHTIRVEYFEAVGSASIRLDIGYLAEYPDWKGEYFTNPNVDGEPETVRNDTAINFNWGTGSPAPGIPADNYSVRWSRSAYFDQGNYTLNINVTGGTRMWVDGRLLIDSWTNAPARTLQAQTGDLAQGYHDVHVDYFKNTGNGAIVVTWAPVTPAVPPTAVIAGPSQVQVGQPSAYNGAGSTAASGNQITSYLWDFGDGTQAQGASVSHVFANVGVYNVTLTVTDNNGLTGSSVLQTNVVAQPVVQPPTAVIRVSQNPALVNQTITFDGSQSTGPSSIISYRWEFGDGFAAEGPTVQYAYTAAGAYLVTLAVVDQNQNRSQAQVQVTINQSQQPTATTPPQATATTPPQPTATTPPQPTATTPPQPTATPTTPPAAGLPLEGIPWILNNTLPNTEITTQFSNGQVMGNSGCNSYTGAYSLNGNNITISVNTSTNLACEPDLMTQEQNFLAQLQAVTTYQISAANLTLSGGGSQLNYAAGPQPR